MTPAEGGPDSEVLKQLHSKMKGLHAKSSRSASFQSALCAAQASAGIEKPARLQPAAETRMTGNVNSYIRVLRNGFPLNIVREDKTTAADVKLLIPSGAEMTMLAEVTAIMAVVRDMIVLLQSESFLTKAAEWPLIMRATQLLRPDGALMVVKWDDSSNKTAASDKDLLTTSVKFVSMSGPANVARARGEQDLLRRFPRPDAVQFMAMRLSPIFCSFDFHEDESQREAWVQEADEALQEEFAAVVAARRKTLGIAEELAPSREAAGDSPAAATLHGMSAPPPKAKKTAKVAAGCSR